MHGVSHPLLCEIPEVIETDRLVLRCPKPGDGLQFFEAVSESLPMLRRYLPTVSWVVEKQSIEAAEIYCRSAYSNFISRKDLTYLILERESRVLVGCVGLHRPIWDLPRFDIGYWCRTSKYGNGYITEAVRVLATFAETSLSAARIELVTDAENLRSRAVAERSGFHLEGILYNDHRLPNGSLRNICVYARTGSREQVT